MHLISPPFIYSVLLNEMKIILNRIQMTYTPLLVRQLFLTSVSLVLISVASQAQDFVIQPYLQNASPNEIYILWETNTGDESAVEFGLSEDLDNSLLGSSFTTDQGTILHEVHITGLERFTNYYYRVITDELTSEVKLFKTPPFANDNQSFTIAAMSDMQKDNGNPFKFQEIIENGVLDYLQGSMGDSIAENLALVMIPGDLVPNGLNYNEWRDDFFGQSNELFNQVPVYPVPGNHENNADYFFQYFVLPENGVEGEEEHTWVKDYGNMRMIGLDSNGPYDSQASLDWLQGVLDTTCQTDSIDFVFAQLHHPHKSELWTPGESDFTGDVIQILEQFTTDCGKPSIHFFGHTHGYSRGQSRDHKHLWINVASAGGALDYWGEWPQFDYDEFTVSQDHYGFVVVDVESGDEPCFTVKRISHGTENNPLDNVITDSLRVKFNPNPVTTPTPTFPINVEVSPECVVLLAQDFEAQVEDQLHGQSHWQVFVDCDVNGEPTAEQWKNHENQYFNEDTQAEDDLADQEILGLNENLSYCWRVRFRDQNMDWSAWSELSPFTTGPSLLSSNLLLNPGAEDETNNWTATTGAIEALEDGECDGIAPFQDPHYFAVGGVCDDNEYGLAYQNIDVSSYSDAIDLGNFSSYFGGYLSNWGGDDVPAMRLIFLDENLNELESTAQLSTLASSWTLLANWTLIPIGTRTIQFELEGTRNAGADNDSYFDELFLRLGIEDNACSVFVDGIAPLKLAEIKVFPNPFVNETSLLLSRWLSQDVELRIQSSNGSKVQCQFTIEGKKISLQRGDLSAGIYFLQVFDEGRLIAKTKLVIQ